ncbi:rhomboid family intramembrane serine protease [Geomonas silvestris]|uniref:Rhomboid family intramembrane serine protease n=1 Tax=Geomonas silvestris TaxID=2740184 RepID=A0A6V8MNA4_9BACT|nr:rhomboid family intramembrane serine protease [Geomonas silvestris]GFO61490.1 rhomboid family intramembrane serine protease [Geomonas silvestris]
MEQVPDPEITDAPEPEWVSIPTYAVDGSAGRLTQRKAQLWALVLESRYLENRILPGEYGWRVQVLRPDLDAATAELKRFVQENRDWPPLIPPVRPMRENTLPTLSVLLLVATFHNLTRLDLTVLGRHPVDWVEIGSAQAHRILDGEWWRLATSLTLHADWLHLLSNLSIGGLFIVYLCRDLGSGLAWSLLLTAGMLGNLVNAEVQLPSHASIGGSTAVFAAVGSLGSIAMMRYRHHLRRRWPVPVAAALALLVLLGSEGKQTDLGAHFFGFLSGLVLGWLTELLIGVLGRPGRLTNAVLCLASSALILFAWWSALTFAD